MGHTFRNFAYLEGMYKFYCSSNLNVFSLPEMVIYRVLKIACEHLCLFVCLMMFNATFNNISVISWRSVLLGEETREPGENHRPVASTFLLYRDLFLLLFCSKNQKEKWKLAKYLTLWITEVQMQLRDYMRRSCIPRMNL